MYVSRKPCHVLGILFHQGFGFSHITFSGQTLTFYTSLDKRHGTIFYAVLREELFIYILNEFFIHWWRHTLKNRKSQFQCTVKLLSTCITLDRNRKLPSRLFLKITSFLCHSIMAPSFALLKYPVVAINHTFISGINILRGLPTHRTMFCNNWLQVDIKEAISAFCPFLS